MPLLSTLMPQHASALRIMLPTDNTIRCIVPQLNPCLPVVVVAPAAFFLLLGHKHDGVKSGFPLQQHARATDCMLPPALLAYFFAQQQRCCGGGAGRLSAAAPCRRYYRYHMMRASCEPCPPHPSWWPLSGWPSYPSWWGVENHPECSYLTGGARMPAESASRLRRLLCILLSPPHPSVSKSATLYNDLATRRRHPFLRRSTASPLLAH